MIKEQIRKEAQKLGIEKLGFKEGAIVALFPYYVKNEPGNISMYARGLDYHIVAERILTELSKTLAELGAGFTKIHVDKGELNDRVAAFEAGLGFFGQNGMLISEKFGSYFFIGQILHDIPIEPDAPHSGECLMCGRCERECPGRALSGGTVKEEKCLSAITQKRGEFSKEEEALVKKIGLCWGCDVCQRVCPHNRGLETTALPDFLTNRIAELDISDVEGLSNREFKKAFGAYAFSWRGKSVLERNLKLFSTAEDNDGKE